jgi:hypothetical protein
VTIRETTFVTGTPTLVNLFCVYIPMIMCAQLEITSFQLLHLLFLVVPKNLRDIYVVDIIQEPYTLLTGDPGQPPDYDNTGNSLEMARACDMHNIETKNP